MRDTIRIEEKQGGLANQSTLADEATRLMILKEEVSS